MLQPDFSTTRGGPKRPEEHPAKDRGRRGGKPRDVEFEPGFRFDRQGPEPFVRQLVEPLGIVSNDGCRPGDGRLSGTPGCQLEFRQNPVPDTIARICHVIVGFILDPCFGSRDQEGLQIGVPYVQERSYERAALRIDPCQARQSGASHELEKKRFCLVVQGVPNRDSVSPNQGCSAPEERVAKAATRILDRHPLRGCIPADINPLHIERQTEPPRKLTTERLVTVGCWSKAMIEVCEADHHELPVLGQVEEKPGQRDRVRSPGHTNENARARGQQRVAADRTADLLVKR
jgi:hypothetical protein